MQYTPRDTSSSQCAAHALYGGRRPTTRTRTCQTQGRQRCCQCPCCSRAAVHAPAAVRGSLAVVGSQRAVVRVASGRPQGPRPPVARRSAAVHSWQGTQPSSTTSRLPWRVAAQPYPLPASTYLEARVSGCPSHPAGAPPPAPGGPTAVLPALRWPGQVRATHPNDTRQCTLDTAFRRQRAQGPLGGLPGVTLAHTTTMQRAVGAARMCQSQPPCPFLVPSRGLCTHTHHHM